MYPFQAEFGQPLPHSEDPGPDLTAGTMDLCKELRSSARLRDLGVSKLCVYAHPKVQLLALLLGSALFFCPRTQAQSNPGRLS